MAQRQLLFLLRRARSSGSSHGHAFYASNDITRVKRVTEYLPDPRLHKAGDRLFSAASRYGGGKNTNPPRKLGGCLEKQPAPSGSTSQQSSAKSAIPTQSSSNISQSDRQGEAPSNPSQKGSSSYVMIVGAFSLAAIGLVTLYPGDLRKLLNFGQKQENKDSFPKAELNKDISNSEFLEAMNNSEDRRTTDAKPHDHPKGSLDQDNKLTSNKGAEIPKPEEEITPVNHAGIGPEFLCLESSSEPQKSSSDSDIPNPSQQEVPVHNTVSSTLVDAPKDIGLPVNLSHMQPESSIPSLHTEETVVSDESTDPIPSESIQQERPPIVKAYQLPTAYNEDISLSDDRSSAHLKHESIDESVNVEEDDETLHKSVKTAFDLLEIVHAAEQRQAEIDAHLHEEAENKLKWAYQQELKDAQVKELMYAEEASRLAKEIEVEKQRSAAALQLEQEKAQERLHEELKRKEEETNLKLKRVELQAKAELVAAIAREKASYLEDVKDVKHELEALQTALSMQSAEVSQRHTAHKLAVGIFALEDAMKRGTPIEREVTLILSSPGDSGLDPLLQAALYSLPKDVVKEGTRTPAQLHHKFESMKSALLELSLLPASGGGLLSHAAAKVVSKLKVTEGGHYSDGMEAIVSQVLKSVTDGKLADAADLLERSVKGTKAELLVAEWVKSARNRAVMEQAVLLLQAHATAIAISLI